MKKTISIFLAFALMLSLIPVAVKATATAADLTYTISNGKVTITGGNKSYSGKLVIPDTIEGFPVTDFDTAAFDHWTELTEVSIPKSVAVLTPSDFQGCTKLEAIWVAEDHPRYSSDSRGVVLNKKNTVIILAPQGIKGEYQMPDSVQGVDLWAFQDCTQLTAVHFSKNLSYIFDSAFYGCTSLTKLDLPPSLSTLGMMAFGNCTGLTDLVIPGTITRFGFYVFYNCDNLTNAVIEENVPYLSTGLFASCDNLTSVTVKGDLSFIGNGAFTSCTSLREVTFHGKVNGILNSAFANCDSLVDFKLPEGVTELGPSVFVRCDNLKTVEIPSGVTAISEKMFIDCTKLRKVTLPDTVTQIGKMAFANSGLSSITLPAGVRQIDEQAFGNTHIRIKFKGNAPEIAEDAFLDANITADYPVSDSTWTEEVRQNYGGSLTWNFYCTEHIPGNWTILKKPTVTKPGQSLQRCAVCRTQLTVKSIDRLASGTNGFLTYTFENDQIKILDCDSTVTGDFTIPDTIDGYPVTTIADGAFSDCTGLTGVTFTEQITSIGKDAFAGCTQLRTVSFPGHAPDIAENAFQKVSAGIYYPANDPTWSGKTGRNYGGSLTWKPVCDTHTPGQWTVSKEPTVLEEGLQEQHCEVCGEVLDAMPVPKLIGGKCGKDVIWCYEPETGLLTVSGSGDMDPDFIPWNQYRNVIRAVKVEEGVESLCDGAFQQSIALTRVELPSTLKTIPFCAFSECTALTQIQMPELVTEIGNYAFFGCTTLEEINLPVDLTILGSHSFSLCRSLTEITIPNGVTVLPANVFTSCSKLSSVTLPQKLTGIGEKAFFGCGSLKELMLPDAVSDIGKMAFYKCTGLKELTVPAGVTAIASDTFYGNTLEALTFRGDAPTFAEDAFRNLTATVRYPGDNKTWTGVAGKLYGGAVTWEGQYSPVVQPTLTLKSPTVEFKDMIRINAFFTAEDTDDVVEMGMITYTKQMDVVDIHTADHVIPGAGYDESSGRFYACSQGIHAKYLADTVHLAIYAKLKDDSYVYTKLVSYSPLTYAKNQLNNASNVELKQLVVSMLNYGAQAQLYFGHNPDQLANSSVTSEPLPYREDMTQKVPAVPSGKQGSFANNHGFSLRRPAVSFEGAFSINYFFTPAYTPVDGITLYYWNEADYNAANVLSAENATGSIAMEAVNGDQYRGDIEGISAKSLSEAFYVAAVYSDGTTTWTSGVLGYSIGAYCAGQISQGGSIADLAKATAVYGYYAKQYFD